MRILLHSTAPWCGTGYGAQTAQLAPRLAAAGHQVAISASHGLEGAVLPWNGIPVYPRGFDKWGSDIVAGHAEHFAADLVLTLCDIWVLRPDVFTQLNTACWFPVDCKPLSVADYQWLHQTGATPVAMSRYGQRMLADADITAHYAPHGVDTAMFTPADQAAARADLGIPADAFVVGINSANVGATPSRKAFPQQFTAFARLRKRHNDALLLLHTEMAPPDGLNLPKLAVAAGIPQDAVVWSQQHPYRAGMFGPDYLANWYNVCDLVSNATYGEGFGLPTVEAQACGVPVVVTDNSASAELLGSGWKVPGVPYWHGFHHAWWSAPDVDQLARTYEKAYDGGAAKRRGDQARNFALRYEADAVFTEHWKPTLELLEEAVDKRTP